MEGFNLLYKMNINFFLSVWMGDRALKKIYIKYFRRVLNLNFVDI